MLCSLGKQQILKQCISIRNFGITKRYIISFNDRESSHIETDVEFLSLGIHKSFFFFGNAKPSTINVRVYDVVVTYTYSICG